MRQLIPYTANLTIGPKGRYCGECHILLSPDNHEYFCYCCMYMLDSILTFPYFVAAHKQWVEDEGRRLRLISGEREGESNGDNISYEG